MNMFPKMLSATVTAVMNFPLLLNMQNTKVNAKTAIPQISGPRFKISSTSLLWKVKLTTAVPATITPEINYIQEYRKIVAFATVLSSGNPLLLITQQNLFLIAIITQRAIHATHIMTLKPTHVTDAMNIHFLKLQVNILKKV